MEKVTLTRQQLFDLVWSEPLLTLSKKYVISDVGLRKMCVRLSIPLPRIGHWAKQPTHRPAPGKLPPSTSREQTKANWFDPFLEAPDDWLSDIDRDTPQKKKSRGTF